MFAKFAAASANYAPLQTARQLSGGLISRPVATLGARLSARASGLVGLGGCVLVCVRLCVSNTINLARRRPLRAASRRTDSDNNNNNKLQLAKVGLSRWLGPGAPDPISWAALAPFLALPGGCGRAGAPPVNGVAPGLADRDALGGVFARPGAHANACVCVCERARRCPIDRFWQTGWR